MKKRVAKKILKNQEELCYTKNQVRKAGIVSARAERNAQKSAK